MIGKRTLESEPIPLSKVKVILEDFSKDHELTYEQNLTLDHATKFSKLSLEDNEKLIEELGTVLKKKHQSVRLSNLMPEDLSDLRLFFAKEVGNKKKEDLEKILEILEPYREKMIR